MADDAAMLERLATLLTSLAAASARLGRIMQAMCADTDLHDQAFDLVAYLEEITLDAEKLMPSPRPSEPKAGE